MLQFYAGNPLKIMKKHVIQTLITSFTLIGITTLIFFYAAGYRIEREEQTIDLKKTGMIGAKSIPEGANVYLNNVLTTATNNTIQGLTPGNYTLKIQKNGFVTWEKEIEVFQELVTDITAVLISQSPRLEPLTNTGAKLPTISPSLDKLAFFTKDGETPGVWVIPLDRQGISLFRSTPYIVIEDAPNAIYSEGVSLEWAPNEKQLLVQTKDEKFYIIDINTGTAETTTSAELTKKSWEEQLIQKRTDFISKLDIPEELKSVAVDPNTIWSPDEKKFLYTEEKDDNIEYHVYNLEKPLPVGEKVQTLVFSVPLGEKSPNISWYADSYHLIMVENYDEVAQRGTISLIRIDGTNKTELYNNTLMFDRAYSAPVGDKIIILTSLKSGEQTDLYTIGIR